jgi:hypothetical protein
MPAYVAQCTSYKHPELVVGVGISLLRIALGRLTYPSTGNLHELRVPANLRILTNLNSHERDVGPQRRL